jgi:glycosyltransferase involved in cell wall biosynthesis
MNDLEVNVICLIPTRNNASLIGRCLQSASLWADYIIVCDQMSTDGTREIALQFQKVKLIDNNSVEYNESVRQKLLITEARKIQGQKLLITLDADEIFTPDVKKTAEWSKILSSRPGTILKFQWANFGPDLKTMWLGYHFPWGYMDDGFEHNESKTIHSGRIPLPDGHEILEINDIKVIHFQFTDWKKMQSKHRYYQCIELINTPDKNVVDLFRQYHHMLAIPKEKIVPIPQFWVDTYSMYGIDILKVESEKNNWFEEQVVDLIEIYGANKFKKINIWDIDWVEIAKKHGKTEIEKFKDPRNLKDKIIQKWLLHTQDKLGQLKYRRIDRVIRNIIKY